MGLVFFDTETTGNGELDRIIQVAALAHFDDKVYEFNELVNPNMPISFEAMEVHHITPNMLINKPNFINTNFFDFLNKVNNNQNYLIAHNIKFDLSMLEKEGFCNQFQLIDTLKCAKVIFPNMNYHRLQYLRYALGLYQHEPANIKAHDALSDVIVLRLLFNLMLQTHNINELVKISKEPVLLNHFSFGKYKGKSIAEVCVIDSGYINWCLNNLLDQEDLIYSIKYHLNNK